MSSVEETVDAFDPTLRWATGARRFEESAAPWFETAALLASVGLLEEVGFDVVEARVLALAQRLGDELAALGFDLAPPWPRAPHESSGIVSVHAPGHVEEIVTRLDEAGVVVRGRGDFVRFSPHFTTTDAEVDRALEAAASARQRVTASRSGTTRYQTQLPRFSRSTSPASCRTLR
jgi:selenocysteine lyase/cysteine desulfurase